VSPVKYKLAFYIPEDDILHSHSRENLKSYIISFCLISSRERWNYVKPKLFSVKSTIVLSASL
jgi:hypothetical protein